MSDGAGRETRWRFTGDLAGDSPEGDTATGKVGAASQCRGATSGATTLHLVEAVLH
jgi:hypothetical protein